MFLDVQAHKQLGKEVLDLQSALRVQDSAVAERSRKIVNLEALSQQLSKIKEELDCKLEEASAQLACKDQCISALEKQIRACLHSVNKMLLDAYNSREQMLDICQGCCI